MECKEAKTKDQTLFLLREISALMHHIYHLPCKDREFQWEWMWASLCIWSHSWTTESRKALSHWEKSRTLLSRGLVCIHENRKLLTKQTFSISTREFTKFDANCRRSKNYWTEEEEWQERSTLQILNYYRRQSFN